MSNKFSLNDQLENNEINNNAIATQSDISIMINEIGERNAREHVDNNSNNKDDKDNGLFKDIVKGSFKNSYNQDLAERCYKAADKVESPIAKGALNFLGISIDSRTKTIGERIKSVKTNIVDKNESLSKYYSSIKDKLPESFKENARDFVNILDKYEKITSKLESHNLFKDFIKSFIEYVKDPKIDIENGKSFIDDFIEKEKIFADELKDIIKTEPNELDKADNKDNPNDLDKDVSHDKEIDKSQTSVEKDPNNKIEIPEQDSNKQVEIPEKEIEAKKELDSTDKETIDKTDQPEKEIDKNIETPEKESNPDIEKTELNLNNGIENPEQDPSKTIEKSEQDPIKQVEKSEQEPQKDIEQVEKGPDKNVEQSEQNDEKIIEKSEQEKTDKTESFEDKHSHSSESVDNGKDSVIESKDQLEEDDDDDVDESDEDSPSQDGVEYKAPEKLDTPDDSLNDEVEKENSDITDEMEIPSQPEIPEVTGDEIETDEQPSTESDPLEQKIETTEEPDATVSEDPSADAHDTDNDGTADQIEADDGGDTVTTESQESQQNAGELTTEEAANTDIDSGENLDNLEPQTTDTSTTDPANEEALNDIENSNTLEDVDAKWNDIDADSFGDNNDFSNIDDGFDYSDNNIDFSEIEYDPSDMIEADLDDYNIDTDSLSDDRIDNVSDTLDSLPNDTEMINDFEAQNMPEIETSEAIQDTDYNKLDSSTLSDETSIETPEPSMNVSDMIDNYMAADEGSYDWQYDYADLDMNNIPDNSNDFEPPQEDVDFPDDVEFDPDTATTEDWANMFEDAAESGELEEILAALL